MATSSLRRRRFAAMFAPLLAFAQPAWCEERAAPTPTVPVPPPEPPQRPAELTSPEPKPADDKATATVPLPPPEPPQRPAELKSPEPTPTDDKPAATVPVPPPEPPQRPAELKSPEPKASEDKPADEKPAATVPVPPPEPPARPPELETPKSPDKAGAPPDRATQPDAAGPGGSAPAAAPLPPARPDELNGAAALNLVVKSADDTACLKRIERLGVKFVKRDPITNGQCSVGNPLSVSALADGIELEPGDTMVCGIAEALARWTTEVQVTAQQELGDTLKSVKLGGAYTCRGQNNATEAKLSEHAFGNAVDIMGFTFAKHPPIMIQARPHGTPEAAFQKVVWAKACKFFRTVLGPGSNSSHDTHLHLDERERSGRNRLCE